MSSIHDSVRNGKVDEVRAFIAKGGDINTIDKHKRTALHLAAWCGNIDILTVLINAKAQLDKKAMDGFTVLHFAVQSNGEHAVECVRLICKKGKVLIQQRITKGNKTALHLAVTKGNIGVVEVLLEYGLDPLAKTSTGQTALDLAKSTEMKQLLQMIDNNIQPDRTEEVAKISAEDENTTTQQTEVVEEVTVEEKKEGSEDSEEQAKKKSRIE